MREEGRGERFQELFSLILGVPPVRIRRAKSEKFIYSTRVFIEDPKIEVIGLGKASYLCYYASRGRYSSYLGLFLFLWTDFYLRGYLAWVKTTLIAVLRLEFCMLICGCV